MRDNASIIRRIPGAVALVLVVAASGALAAGQIGETAADFNLESLDGGFISLSQHAGKVVLLTIIGYG